MQDLKNQLRENKISHNFIQQHMMFDPQTGPRVTAMREGNSYGAFRERIYRFGGVDSLEDMYAVLSSDEVMNTRDGDVKFVSLFFRHLRGNQGRFVSIRSHHLDSFDAFQNRIESQIGGDVAGSDAVSEDDFELEMTFAKVATFILPTALGGTRKMLYRTEGLKSKKGDCVAVAMAQIGYPIQEHMSEKLRSVPTLIQYLRDNHLPVRVIGNSILLRKGETLADIQARNGTEFVAIPNKRVKTQNDQLKCVRLTPDDYEPPVFFQPDAWKYTLVFDTVREHVDVLSGDAVLREEVMLSNSLDLIMGSKVVMSSKEIRINAVREIKGSKWFCFFDFETVIDFDSSSIMRPYSLSVMLLRNEDVDLLSKADAEDDKETVAKIRKESCLTFVGFDCGIRFLEWFTGIQSDKVIIFVGFNNSSFDNIILLDLLLNTRQTEHMMSFTVSNVFYNGSRLLNMTINGRHRFHDVHNHLMGSLAHNCKSFRIKSCSKLSFNHDEMQQKYQDGTLAEFITGNQDLIDYNELDNISCCVLFARYRDALRSMACTEKYADELESIGTIGSLIYKVWKDWTCTMFGDKCFSKLDYDQFKSLVKHRVAGRVQCFQGPVKIQERIVSTDVTSLYPYVMCIGDNCWYPMGNITRVDEFISGRLGFWYCDFDQSGLKHQNLPTIWPRKTETENDWTYDGLQQGVLLSNVTIDLLRKYGCTVTTHDGFVFEAHVRGCDLFRPLLDIMTKKNEQDDLKAAGSPLYQESLRSTFKLLMNSLSGKVAEGLHCDQTRMISSTAEYLLATKDALTVNHISTCGNKYFVSFTLDEAMLCSKDQRPIFLGSLLYDYAKRHMYDFSYARIGLSRLLYTDTDCCKFRHSYVQEFADRIRDENVVVPHWAEIEDIDAKYKTHLIYQPGSKVFGALEDELEEDIGTEYVFYALAKKVWSYAWLVDGKWHHKTKLKGVNEHAFLLTGDEPIFGANMKIVLSQRELWVWSMANQARSIAKCNFELMERLWLHREARVLCSSFRKIVKNSRRNVAIDDVERHAALSNVIQVQFSVKHLKIADVLRTSFA